MPCTHIQKIQIQHVSVVEYSIGAIPTPLQKSYSGIQSTTIQVYFSSVVGVLSLSHRGLLVSAVL